MSTLLRAAIPLLLVLFPFAQARAQQQDYRAHPEYQTRMASVKTVGVVQPKMRVFELTAGGGRDFKPDWSEQSAQAVGDAIAAALGQHALSVKRIAPVPQVEEEMRDVVLLYEAVHGAILQATYANEFPRKMARFEYSLGDLDSLLAQYGVDAVVFSYGSANISSSGRRAVQVLGALFGPGYSVGIDRIQLALVDRSGTVLWFAARASTSHDLRDPQSAEAFVRGMTMYLPAVKAAEVKQ